VRGSLDVSIEALSEQSTVGVLGRPHGVNLFKYEMYKYGESKSVPQGDKATDHCNEICLDKEKLFS
jgi:hypothetical protein